MDGDVIQVLVFIVIGLAYGLAWALKRINAWINRNRIPDWQREKTAQEGTATEQAVQGDERRKATPEGEKPASMSDLVRELERALGGQPSEEAPRPKPAPRPAEAETPAQRPSYAPDVFEEDIRRPRVEEPAPPMRRQVTSRPFPPAGPTPLPHGAPLGEYEPKTPSTTRGRVHERRTATGIELHKAAHVLRRHYDHLALLRSRDDLNRAILLHEILQPPVSRRRGERLRPPAAPRP